MKHCTIRCMMLCITAILIRNLVKLHGIVFTDRDVMVVMELVSGGGLDSYLKKKTIAERLATLRLDFHRNGGDV
ncbi:hypothetical protein KIN20_009812 [Parelaphostrongylus tenuis]|uniref:Serine-threonine/tyrosine-protein kinase catalytic domain-containing protein n=1 Tax=Parelaphostrongylus tenuis TaxID=148309 RepID=A0AAD5QIF5_PARTN|nr:hypothetical protein KIN20_009812 [Parelaphostrongylus tenuis]